MRWSLQRLSAGLVLGGEAFGGLVLHESHSLLLTAVIVVVAILITVWLLESGIDLVIRYWNWAANLFGTKLDNKGKIHGFWYSKVYNKDGVLLGGSVFRIQAGIDGFKLRGDYMDVKMQSWSWWDGTGSPFTGAKILYGYKGEENNKSDEGFGMYEFAGDNPPDKITGSFYGKDLNGSESRTVGGEYRTISGGRCARAVVNRKFRKDPEVRKRWLEGRLHDAQPPPVTPAAAPAVAD
jgi:hypothetical protein